MTQLEQFTVRALWGYWELNGKWYPNPYLKMSTEEQARQNADTLSHDKENQKDQ